MPGRPCFSYSYVPQDVAHAAMEMVAERYRYKNQIGEGFSEIDYQRLYQLAPNIQAAVETLNSATIEARTAIKERLKDEHDLLLFRPLHLAVIPDSGEERFERSRRVIFPKVEHALFDDV